MEGSKLALLHEIAAMDPFYEAEYAHRMEKYCRFCDAHDGAHELDCLYLRITEAIK